MTMAENNENQKNTEDAISAARTAIVHIYDELLPEAQIRHGLRDSIRHQLDTAMNRMDAASNALMEFGFDWHNAADDATELESAVAVLEEQVDATEFGLLAQSLLHELRGRMMTDSPERVVWWMEHALVTVLDAPTPDDEADANKLLTAATWGN